MTGPLGWTADATQIAVSSPAWDSSPRPTGQQSGRIGIMSIADATRLTIDQADSMIECDSSQCFLGQELLATDLDGDGINDLLASVARIGTDTSTPSMLASYLGPIEGTLSSRDYDGGLLSTSNDRIGERMVNLGDSDGDGYDEIWMSAYLEGAWTSSGSGGSGALYRYAASDLAGPTATGEAANLTIVAGISIAKLGFSLSHGDVNGDGQLDLLAGANESELVTGTLGSAHLWYGPLSGTLSTDDDDVTFTAESYGGDLGWSVAADDDLNGDGCDDVVVSEPCWPGKGMCYGAVGVFYGGCE